MKIKNLILILLSMAMMLSLASCHTEPVTPNTGNQEQPGQGITPGTGSEAAPTTGNACINIIISDDSVAKTIRPDSDSLADPNYYECTIQSLTNDSLSYTAKTSENTIHFNEILLGDYSVAINAYLKSGEATPVLLYEGVSTSPLSVTVEGENTTSIKLNAINHGDLTGSVKVLLDWTEISKAENIVKDVVSTSDINVKFFFAEDYSENDYNPEYQLMGTKTVTAASGNRSIEFTQDGIPVTGKGVGYFGLYYTENSVEYLLAEVGFDSYQIYSSQVSVPTNPDLYVIKSSNVPAMVSEIRLTLDYGEDPTTDLMVTWNNATSVSETRFYDTVQLSLFLASDLYNPIETATISVGETFTQPQSFTFETELEKGKTYVVKAKGRTLYGRETAEHKSNYFQPKVLVESVTIDESTMPTGYITNGESFKLNAIVGPSDATFKSLKWSSTADDIFNIIANDSDSNTVTLIAKRPGKTKITATSTDNASVSDTTSTDIAVRLRKPEKPEVTVLTEEGGKAIQITWTQNDAWATTYDLYRTVVDSNGNTSTSRLTETTGDYYVDSNLHTNKSHSYYVIAKNDALITENYNPISERSKATEAIKPVVPTITLVQPTIGDLSLQINKGEEVNPADILVTPEQSQTLTIPAPIEGAVKYSWFVNDQHIKTSSTFEDIQSIELRADMNAVQERGGDANILTLIVEDANGNAHSTSCYFRVVTVVDTGVEIYNNLSLISKTNNSTYQIEASVYPYNATMKGLTYSTTTPDVVEVSSTGLVTLKGIGRAEITIAPTYGTPATMSFDVYNSINDELTLLNWVTEALKTDLAYINGEIKTLWGTGDWWHSSENSAKTKDGKVSVTMKGGASLPTGTMYIYDKAIDTDTHGTIFLNSSNIVMRAVNRGDAGNLGVDPLNYIGYENGGTITVTLPYNQGTAYIQTKHIDVISKTGSYDVTLPNKTTKNIGAYDSGVTPIF